MQNSPCLFEILKLHPVAASCLGELPYFTYSAIFFFSIMKVLAGHVAQFFYFFFEGRIFRRRGTRAESKGSGAEIFHQKGKRGGAPCNPPSLE